MGTTINLAHKAGKVLEVVGLACLLIIPVTSVWMMFEEFTPLQLYLENDTIIAKQINVDYEIPVEDITYIEMIEELPEMTKISGSGMDNLLKGKFEIFHQGCVQVFLNPQTDCFIYLETNDTHYYLGASTRETVLYMKNLWMKNRIDYKGVGKSQLLVFVLGLLYSYNNYELKVGDVS